MVTERLALEVAVDIERLALEVTVLVVAVEVIPLEDTAPEVVEVIQPGVLEVLEALVVTVTEAVDK